MGLICPLQLLFLAVVLTTGAVLANCHTQAPANENRRRVSPELAAAYARLERLCEFPFIECLKKTDTDKYLVLSGSYGAGVIADVNTQFYRLTVYHHLHIDMEGNPIPASNNAIIAGKIRMFIKTPQTISIPAPIMATGTDWEHLYALDRDIRIFKDNFQLEKKRSRALAGTGLAPVVYDLIFPEGPTNYFLRGFLFSEFFPGIAASKLVTFISKDLMDDTIVHIDAMVRETNKMLANGIPLDRAQVMFENSHLVKLFITETSIRFRGYLVFLLSALNLAKRLWRRGLHHCDMHAGNIFVKSRVLNVTDPAFSTFIKNGLAISPHQLRGYSLSELDSVKDDLVTINKPLVELVMLDFRSLKVVDLAYAVALQRRVLDRTGYVTPCSTYRGRYFEELGELNRAVLLVTDQIDFFAKRVDALDPYIGNQNPLAAVINQVIKSHWTRLVGMLKLILEFTKTNPDWVRCAPGDEATPKNRQNAPPPQRDRRPPNNPLRRQRTPPRDNRQLEVCTTNIEQKALNEMGSFLTGMIRQLQAFLPPNYRTAVEHFGFHETRPSRLPARPSSPSPVRANRNRQSKLTPA